MNNIFAFVNDTLNSVQGACLDDMTYVVRRLKAVQNGYGEALEKIARNDEIRSLIHRGGSLYSSFRKIVESKEEIDAMLTAIGTKYDL